MNGHKNGIESVAFSPDGGTLATVRISGAVVGCTGKHKRTLRGYPRGVYSLAFSPDGKTLVTASPDQTVWLWDTETWERKWKSAGDMGWPDSIAFSPDGTTIVSTSVARDDGAMVHLWDAATERKGTLRRPDGEQDGAVVGYRDVGTEAD